MMLEVIGTVGAILQAVAAVALFFVTRELVKVTRQLAHATEKLVQAEAVPEIQISAPGRISNDSAKLTFRNVGGCTAIDAELTISGVVAYQDEYGQPIEKVDGLGSWDGKKEIEVGDIVHSAVWDIVKRVLDLPTELPNDAKMKGVETILRLEITCRSSVRREAYSFRKDYLATRLPSGDVQLKESKK